MRGRHIAFSLFRITRVFPSQKARPFLRKAIKGKGPKNQDHKSIVPRRHNIDVVHCDVFEPLAGMRWERGTGLVRFLATGGWQTQSSSLGERKLPPAQPGIQEFFFEVQS